VDDDASDAEDKVGQKRAARKPVEELEIEVNKSSDEEAEEEGEKQKKDLSW